MSKQNQYITAELQNKIFRFSLRLINNYEEAQDVVQDVLEKLWREKHKLKQLDNVEAYAIRMAKNTCLNRFKHQKIIDDNINRELVLGKNHEHPDYETKELTDIIKQLIAQLPDKQKMAIHLRDVEGMEFKEISDILEVDTTSVRMNLSRARKTIKEQLIKIEHYGL